jgi:transposase-like protein
MNERMRRPGLYSLTAWLLTQKLRRSMVDSNRAPLEGVVEVDQAEIPFRAGDAFFEPGNAGKILVIGAVEVIDRGTNQAKPRRKRAKYLDTRSGRLRLAVIANNSAASIEAFVRANVKPGTTLLTDGHASYPGLSGYRHDPRVVGTMAGHVVLPWSHRAFSLLKRWALGTYHGLRRKHVDTYLNEFVFRYNSSLLSPCFIRNAARARHPPRAHRLLGHHQARQSSQKRQPAPRAAPTTYRRT